MPGQASVGQLSSVQLVCCEQPLKEPVVLHAKQSVWRVFESIPSTTSSSQYPTTYRQRKCADIIGTVLVPWAGHFNAKI